MKQEELTHRASAIAELVVGMKQYEWSRIKVAIDKKFSSASNRVELSNAEELKRAIELEF